MAEDPNAELSRAEYWDKRYGSSEPTAATYDWLRNFNTIKPFLTKYLPHASTNPEIVHMGNGNSVCHRLMPLLGGDLPGRGDRQTNRRWRA